ncbi:MAG: thioesterase domain-containing protein, partial [Rhodococcus sp. (in: high G+C Gram-positive bacteria)]
FAGLASHVAPSTPIYGLQSPALTLDEPLPESLFDVAERYVGEIRTVQPEGPYRLLGWSLGGTIAHAIATSLRASGESVEMLAMLDSHGGPDTDTDAEPVSDSKGLSLADLLGAVGADADGHGAGDLRLDSFEDAARMISETPAIAGVVNRTQVERMLASAANSAALLGTHVPHRFDGDVVFFTAAADDPQGSALAQSWEPYVEGRILDHRVNATHWSMTSESALAVIGRTVREFLSGS